MSSIGVIVRAEGPAESLATDWVPVPLGAREALATLLVSAGGRPMNQPSRFDFRGGGLSLELEIGDDEPPRSITASGVFGTEEVALLQSLCERLSAKFYDSEEGDFAF
jgi:hypothetical protein